MSAPDLPFGRARLGGVPQCIPLAGHTDPLIALLSPLGWAHPDTPIAAVGGE